MKNYWKSYAIIACSAILITCSTNEGIRDVDSGNVQNTGNIESEINANLILVNYMHVVDSCVVLNLSQKEAEALGVSDYYYQKAQKTVLEVNKAMKESIKEHPDWPVYLKGPKELREENDSIAVSQTRSEEPLSSGRLNAPDQAEVSKFFSLLRIAEAHYSLFYVLNDFFSSGSRNQNGIFVSKVTGITSGI